MREWLKKFFNRLDKGIRRATGLYCEPCDSYDVEMLELDFLLGMCKVKCRKCGGIHGGVLIPPMDDPDF